MVRAALSIVAPVHNEEDCIVEFYNRLAAILQIISLPAEIVFVNDGSSDSSLNKLKSIRGKDERVKILDFSRNFGHQIAIKAGIDHASGEMVVIIDSDLQDPPKIRQMINNKSPVFNFPIKASDGKIVDHYVYRL